MSYKWDDKLTERFLNLYRKHQCLWNPYSPDYKNCSVKNEAFRIVIQELNVPRIRISECLQQIEVIREKYKQEQLKAEKKLASGQLYTSKLPWFNLMSQMLCEVINDEENFREVPVKYTPCTVTKDQRNTDPKTTFTLHQESSNPQQKPKKYAESRSKRSNNFDDYITPKDKLQEYRDSGSKKTTDENNNLQHKSKVVDDASELWNACPTCGWETGNNSKKTYNGGNEFNNYKENAARFHPETEVPLQIKPTQILKTNNNTGKVHEISNSNWRIKTPETDKIQVGKKTPTNSGSENSRGKLCVSVQPEKLDQIEDKVLYRDDTKTKESHGVMSSNENNVHCPRSPNEFEKNVIICPNQISDIHHGRFLENQQRNFEMNQTNHLDSKPNLVLYQDAFALRSQKKSEFEKEADRNKKMSTDCNSYNSCIQQFGIRSKKLTTSDEDKYEVCSRFKIIIPTSDEEDRSLEITGYEVCVLNPQLSRYMLCPSSEISKVAIDNVECACKNEFSTRNKKVKEDSTRYSNIIKLAINHKRSKEPRAKKRSHTSAATCTREATSPENDQDSEIDLRHKSFANKKTQTDRSFENQSNQTSKNMERSKFDYSKSVKNQGCAIDVSSLNEIKSCCATNSYENDNLIRQENQSLVNDHSIISQNTSMPSQVENSSLPVDRFNNTRIFLNVIVKILESDSTHNISEDLQTTLNTMLDRFEKSGAERHADNSIENDTTISTQYQSFALNPVPAERQAKNIRPQRANNYATVDLSNTANDFRPQTVELEDTAGTTYGRPQSLIFEETNRTANTQAGENMRKSWPALNETNRSNNERATESYEPQTSLMENTSNSVHSALDYTNEFLNEEPVASSSKRFREQRSPNQLTKDFLDVIKYTMMMDGVLPAPPENDDRDCCNQAKGSTDP